MTQDEQQLDLLSIFHFVMAGLTALFSCIFLIHVAIGIAMLTGALDGKGDEAPRFLGWIFIVLPGLMILAGWTLAGFMVAAGLRLKRRTSRIFCLAVAAVECILLPFGTVLGVFTIVLLSKEPVQALFAAGRRTDAR